jgi:hypothetical protein
MPEINQKNLVLGGQALTTYSGIEIQASSNYELEITGLGPYVGDITYSFYNLDGTAISLEQTDFGIPAGTYREQSEACVVEISVKWGRVENYRLYKYYLKCNF